MNEKWFWRVKQEKFIMESGMRNMMRTLWMFAISAVIILVSLTPGEAQSDAFTADIPKTTPVSSTAPEVTYGKVQSIPASEVSGTDTMRSTSATVRCNQQNITMSYPELRFTGTKKWCYDGRRVTQGTMEVSTFIQAEHRYTQSRDGWVYVPGALKSSDQFVTINGVERAAHKSVRTGRFEYRINGQAKPQAVYIPSVTRTGYGNGDCRGPKPADIAPKILAISPNSASTGVSRGAMIIANINMQVKEGTSNEGTFYLINTRTGEYVEGQTGRDAGDLSTILIIPDKPLAASTTYKATIAAGPNGVLGATGDPLQTGITWKFTTGTRTD